MIVCMRIVLEMRSRDELDKLVWLNWLFCRDWTDVFYVRNNWISCYIWTASFFAGPAGHLNNNSSKRWNSFYASRGCTFSKELICQRCNIIYASINAFLALRCH
jgi:hypothetical protein